MNTAETISIVVPVYNAEKYLARCHETLLAQTYKAIEIVYVDDGSNDRSAELLKEFASQDRRVKVIAQDNRGTLIARQVGVEATSGDWVMFLDPDDSLHAEACAKALAASKAVDVVSFGAELEVESEAESLKDLDKYLNPTAGLVEGDIVKAIFTNGRLAANLWGKLIRGALCREAFREQIKIRALYAEDIYAMFLVARRAKSVRIIPDKLYRYRVAIGITAVKPISTQGLEGFLNVLALGEDLCRYGDEGRLFRDKTVSDLLGIAIERADSAQTLQTFLPRLINKASAESLSSVLKKEREESKKMKRYISELEDALRAERNTRIKRLKTKIKELLHVGR